MDKTGRIIIPKRRREKLGLNRLQKKASILSFPPI
jgi:bifunctional DNA-binding transcriptional regulator/antitoxin component of YhaV-PrlF toxin-antitoxin module